MIVTVRAVVVSDGRSFVFLVSSSLRGKGAPRDCLFCAGRILSVLIAAMRETHLLTLFVERRHLDREWRADGVPAGYLSIQVGIP